MNALLAGASPREIHERAERAHREAEEKMLPTCTKCGQRCESAKRGRWSWVSPCCAAPLRSAAEFPSETKEV